MTGQELFNALSFVDEQYIEEAENAWISSGTPWRKILSVAACLCILIAGAFGMRNLGMMDKAAAPEAAAPAPMEVMTESSFEEAAPPMAKGEITTEAAGEPATIPGELHYVAFAQVRILNVLEDGSFEVLVEKVSEEPCPFEVGVKMTLVIDPNMIPAPDRTDREYPGDVTVDMLVEIQSGTYDAGINTLYAEGVLAAAQE